MPAKVRAGDRADGPQACHVAGQPVSRDADSHAALDDRDQRLALDPQRREARDSAWRGSWWVNQADEPAANRTVTPKPSRSVDGRWPFQSLARQGWACLVQAWTADQLPAVPVRAAASPNRPRRTSSLDSLPAISRHGPVGFRSAATSGGTVHGQASLGVRPGTGFPLTKRERAVQATRSDLEQHREWPGSRVRTDNR